MEGIVAILAFVGFCLSVAVLLAVLRLSSIDATLKRVLAELQGSRSLPVAAGSDSSFTASEAASYVLRFSVLSVL